MKLLTIKIKNRATFLALVFTGLVLGGLLVLAVAKAFVYLGITYNF